MARKRKQNNEFNTTALQLKTMRQDLSHAEKETLITLAAIGPTIAARIAEFTHRTHSSAKYNLDKLLEKNLITEESDDKKTIYYMTSTGHEVAQNFAERFMTRQIFEAKEILTDRRRVLRQYLEKYDPDSELLG